MKHKENILKLLETLTNSKTFHSMVVEGPAGWGKTTSVEEALRVKKVKTVHIGAYSTPLALYQTLEKNRDSVILLDDSAGLIGDPKAMAVLKAATWSGNGGEPRVIRWTSTSDRIETKEFCFDGKIIILTNSLSRSRETLSYLSRSLTYRIRLSLKELKSILINASKDRNYFPNSERALEVAEYLVAQMEKLDIVGSADNLAYGINLRTLSMGYELAHLHEAWKPLLSELLPHSNEMKIPPKSLVDLLSQRNIPVRVQIEKFRALTGLSRRTFFNYRKSQGLSRDYYKIA